MFYNIIKSIFPSLKNTIISTLILTSSLVAYAGVYKQGTLDAFNGIVDNGTELIAVGDVGMIYAKTLAPASLWTNQNSGSVFRLLDVDAAASYEDIAVGELGTILTRRSGSTTWSSENSGTLLSLRKVLVDPNNGNNIIVGDGGVILFYDKVSSVWVAQTSGSTENLTAIVSNSDSSLYTALGESGAVITSPDGKNWTVQSGFSAIISDAIFYTTSAGVDQYFAVGGLGLYESSDGINWSYVKNLIGSSKPYSKLNDISYSAATIKLRVVGDNGLNVSSSDNGVNWSGYYGGNTLSAPINNYATYYTAAYTDTLVGSISNISNSGLLINDMLYNSTAGLYIAVGNNGTIITSTDGKNWSISNFTSTSSEDVIAISLGGGQFSAITTGGNLLTSTNGIDWVSTTWVTSWSIALTIRDMAVDSTGNVHVAIAENLVYTRTDDGAGTVVETSSSQNSLNSVIYSAADSQFVAVGENTIKTSPDGITWTNQATGATPSNLKRLQGVFYNSAKDLYVAVGRTTNTHLVMTSLDAITWVTTAVDNSGPELFSVTYDADYNLGSGQYFAAGYGGAMVSPDGVTWTPVKNSLTPTTRFKAVVYDGTNKQYVAGGERAVSIFTSQLIAPTFTPFEPVITIESTSLYMTLTADLTRLDVTDYAGKYIRPTLISTAPNSRPYTMGPYTLTWEAIDNFGNRAQFDQSIVIKDTTAPTLTLNGQASIALEAGGAYVDQGATVTDAVDTSIVVSTGGSFVDTSRIGDFTITYSAMDTSSNSAAGVSRAISVTDTVPPSISFAIGTQGIVINTTGEFTQLTAQTPLAQPNISDATSVTLTNDAPVSGYSVGDTVVTWTATDAGDNTATVSQTVTVLADTIAPQISLLGQPNTTVNFGDTYSDSGARVFDAVDKNINIVVVSTVKMNVVGIYTVTYNATDYSNNKAIEVIRTVNVVDRQAPVITLVGSTTMRIEVGAGFSEPGSSVTDNVDSNLSVSITGSVNPNAVGNYTLTYTATDSSNNVASVTRAVEVFMLADTEKPIVIAPAPITIASPDGSGIANGDSRIQAFLGGATATDNVGVVVIGPNGTPGTFPIGTTNVTFTASDAAGNQGSVVSTITITAPVVADTTPPVITIQSSISLSSTDGNGISINNSELQVYLKSIQVSDNSGFASYSRSALPDTLPIGDTNVTFTADDNAGNQTEVTVTITVVDDSPATTTPPVTSTPAESSGGGGSMGWFMILMAGMLFLTRRLKATR